MRAGCRLRVLLVCGSYPPMQCGVGEYSATLAAALARYGGCEIGVLTSVPATASPAVAIATTWRFRELLRILRDVRRWRPDLVHFQFPAQGYRGPLPFVLPTLLRLLRIPIVITWHEFLDRAKLVFLPNVVAPRAMIVVRPEFRDRLAPLLRSLAGSRSITFIPNASTIPARSLSDAERQAIRDEVSAGRPFVVFFGFPYHHKGVDLLFEIADPAIQDLVIVGRYDESDEYHRELRRLSDAEPWRGHVTFTGYKEPEDVAALLAAADAVVLPFRKGGGVWNTSIHAAVQQGTFTLTTSADASGFDEATNVYYARTSDVQEMRDALRRHAGRRASVPPDGDAAAWRALAEAHRAVYERAVDR